MKKKTYILHFSIALFILAGRVLAAPGNVDGIGEVDLKDAILTLQVCAGNTVTVTGVSLDSDVNGDGRIGLAEAIYILKSLSNSSRALGDLGIPDDYEETLLNFRESFPATAGSFDNFAGQLPESFDWRDFGVVTRAKRGGNPITPIEDQGSCGSCWAFGAVAALESKILMAGGPEYDLSEQQQVSCNTSQYGCCGGFLNAAEFWIDRGPLQESCTDYGDYTTTKESCGCKDFPPYIHCSNVSCSSFSSCTRLSYRVKDYHTVDVSSTEEVKISIYGYGPGVFSYPFYQDFYDFWYHGSYGQVYVQTSSVRKGGHIVSIIGWDDQKGAWLCKNSWGVEGPNGDGTFWIAYSGHKNNLRFGMSNFSITGGTACEYSIYPQGQSFSSSGGTASIDVTANTGCSWTANSSASWITITSGNNGSGSGKVYYSVSSNSDTASRTGNIIAGGKEFKLTQSGQSCSYSITPVSKSFEASGGTGSISVTATTGCNWTAKSNSSWISVVSGSSRISSGTVNYSVAQNIGTDSRTGTLTAAGKTFTITQSGTSCTYTISPSSQTIGPSGGTGSVNVTVSNGCVWTAESSEKWIYITSGSNGTGNGTVSYSVASNTGTSSRTGTLTIAGKIFTVTLNGVTGEDRPVSGDYDGDGKADPAVWRKNDTSGFPMLYIIPSSTACPSGWDGPYETWGGCGKQIGMTIDIPVSGDYDGDGKADPAAWRKDDTSGFPMLYIIPSSTSCPSGWDGPYAEWGGCGKQIGTTVDIPVSGDYDGDRKADPAVWRENDISGFPMLYIIPSSISCPQGWDGPYAEWGGCGKQVGLVADIPVGGDFDGDGKTDPATWRQNDSSGYPRIYIRTSSGNCPDSSWEGPYAEWGGCSKQIGLVGDIPVAGDYDGDGRADPASWRKNDISGFPMLYIRPSSGNCPNNRWEGPYPEWGGCGFRLSYVEDSFTESLGTILLILLDE